MYIARWKLDRKLLFFVDYMQINYITYSQFLSENNLFRHFHPPLSFLIFSALSYLYLLPSFPNTFIAPPIVITIHFLYTSINKSHQLYQSVSFANTQILMYAY